VLPLFKKTPATEKTIAGVDVKALLLNNRQTAG
jgi:hypothetical protein